MNRHIKRVAKTGVHAIRRSSSLLYHTGRLAWPVWCYVLNRTARAHYRNHPIPVSLVQQRVVNELTTNGIGVVHLTDLIPDCALQDFLDLGEAYVQQPENQRRILEAEEEKAALKYFLVHLWRQPVLDLKNKLMALALSEEVLGIVAGYLGLSARLIYMQLWYNLPTNSPPILSQNWHRDQEDKKVVKIFLYLRDVDESSGPFCYIPGTHHGGPHAGVFPCRPPEGSRPSPLAVEARFSEPQRKTYIGKAGTLIFCDTAGLHKGGYATGRERLLFTAMYLTDGAIPYWARKEKNFVLDQQGYDFLSPAGQYAIGYWKDNAK